jgi:hypothetical protein
MTPEQKEALDEFGKAVVTEVYDGACSHLQGVISHRWRSRRPDELHLAYKTLDEKAAEVARELIVDAIDQTFAQFLHFFDVHEIPIPFKTQSGEVIDVRAASDGLAAEPYNEWGWIAMYSNFKGGIQEMPK